MSSSSRHISRTIVESYQQELHQTAPARWLDARYERQVLEQADVVLTTSPDTRRLLLGKSKKLEQSKFHVIPNGYDESDFRQPSTLPNDALLITHTGTISETYHVQELLRAVAACGGDAEIVAPASLRRAMHRFAVQALAAEDERAGVAQG